MKRLTTVNFGYDDDDAEDGSGSGGSPSSSGKLILKKESHISFL